MLGLSIAMSDMFTLNSYLREMQLKCLLFFKGDIYFDA